MVHRGVMSVTSPSRAGKGGREEWVGGEERGDGRAGARPRVHYATHRSRTVLRAPAHSSCLIVVGSVSALSAFRAIAVLVADGR